MEKLKKNSEGNIKAGFAKCGIEPFCPENVMKRVPDKEDETSDTVNESVNQTLITLLEEMRDVPSSTPCRKKKRLNAEPGKSVSVGTSSSDSEDIDDDVPEINPEEHDNPENEENSNEGNNEEKDNSDENGENSNESDKEEQDNLEENGENSDESDNSQIVPYELQKGDFVIVKFKTNKCERRFIAQVLDSNVKHLNVKFLRKKTGIKVYFMFPPVDDIAIVNHKDVERKIAPMSERRGQYIFL